MYQLDVCLAGVTLMALGAMAKYPGLDVKIVPCGEWAFHVFCVHEDISDKR